MLYTLYVNGSGKTRHIRNRRHRLTLTLVPCTHQQSSRAPIAQRSAILSVFQLHLPLHVVQRSEEPFMVVLPLCGADFDCTSQELDSLSVGLRIHVGVTMIAKCDM